MLLLQQNLLTSHTGISVYKRKEDGLKHSELLKDSISQWVNQIKATSCFAENSTATADKTFLLSDWTILPDIINSAVCDQQ